ncbi:MAG: DNA replication and repair protein RecF [Spirochaetes bacterium]|jgi:DNA replication and repair protein RecF|nr:DNA replication and repair protein RecF [Spirochaetota bacterium]
MHLKKLTVKNFRNYYNNTFEFCNSYNFITGANGTGKSNILEAVSVLSNIKSFRNASDRAMIKQYESYYYINGVVAEDTFENVFEAAFQNKDKIKKKYKINNSKVDRLIDYYGKFITVNLSPTDTDLIIGEPEKKRRYIDSVISKIDKEYFKKICEYKRILNNRNTILKSGIVHLKNIQVWNELLAEKSSYIIKKREKFLNDILDLFANNYQKISNENDSVSIKYRPSVTGETTADILNQIENNQQRDKRYKTTTLGPHRDSYSIKYRGVDCSLYASNGQLRSLSIALKLAEKNIVEENLNKKAVILIDDIFSELDRLRRHNLIRLMKNQNQVLFTVPTVEDLSISDLADSTILNLDK